MDLDFVSFETYYSLCFFKKKKIKQKSINIRLGVNKCYEKQISKSDQGLEYSGLLFWDLWGNL